MYANKALLAAIVMALSTAGAYASSISVVYGDKDCFGIPTQGGTACGTGLDYTDDLGGVFFSDHREATDPLTTDNWVLGSISFTIDLALPTGFNTAALDVFHAGAATTAPAFPGAGKLFFNGILLGDFGGGNNLSTLTTYDITSLIATSNTVNIALVSSGDGWSLDYAEIRMLVDETVPEPATLALFGLGLAALGTMNRKKRLA